MRTKFLVCCAPALVVAVAGCAPDSPTDQSETEVARYQSLLTDDVRKAEPTFGTKGWVKTGVKWASPKISVCWENLDPQFQREREWVVEALASSWEASSAVDFTGFGQCSNTSRGIRVVVADAGARTLGLGKELDGIRNGLRLNFAFGSWNRWCSKDPATRESCLRANAVHEFGHAIGFVHEQNRHDTPESCTADRQGSDGDLILTPWDARSIMNYCNTQRMLEGGKLSDGDKLSVSAFYGQRT